MFLKDVDVYIVGVLGASLMLAGITLLFDPTMVRKKWKWVKIGMITGGLAVLSVIFLVPSVKPDQVVIHDRQVLLRTGPERFYYGSLPAGVKVATCWRSLVYCEASNETTIKIALRPKETIIGLSNKQEDVEWELKHLFEDREVDSMNTVLELVGGLARERDLKIIKLEVTTTLISNGQK